MQKICKKCSIEKSTDEFYLYRKDGSRKSDYTDFCKYCHNRRSTKEQVKSRNNKAKIKRDFGLTVDEYKKYFEIANYKCEICNSGLRLSLDHNHATGKIRGVLCMNCNTALGHVKDDIKILEGLIEWLRVKS